MGRELSSPSTLAPTAPMRARSVVSEPPRVRVRVRVRARVRVRVRVRARVRVRQHVGRLQQRGRQRDALALPTAQRVLGLGSGLGLVSTAIQVAQLLHYISMHMRCCTMLPMAIRIMAPLYAYLLREAPTLCRS